MMDFKLLDFSAIGVAIFIVILTLWIKSIYKATKRGLKFVFPLPLFGNNLLPAFHLKQVPFVADEIYRKFPEEKYVAYFHMDQMTYLLRDPSLISEVAVKNFDHFINHTTHLDEHLDPLIFYSLFQLTGDKWKDMRSSLSPAFTGAKMREMLPFLKDCAEALIKHVNNKIDEGDGVCEIETKSLMMRCASDAISSCAFGIINNSLDDPQNKFYTMGEEIAQITPRQTLKLLPIGLFPKLCKIVGYHFMRDEQNSYYRNIVKEVIKQREETGIVRRDMIHLLMLARKGKLENDLQNDEPDQASIGSQEILIRKKGQRQNWSDDILTAQAVNFLVAGLETTATLLGFLFYELATNEDCQRRLQKEIDECIETNGQDVDFSTISRLKYLDMVITETLRLRPPVGLTDRICGKEFELPPTGNNTTGVKVQRNDIVLFPIYSLHMDPKYWKDPTVFDPERFSDENRSKIKPNTYIPFGAGPRACIGNRFAIIESKVFAFYILSHFDLTATSKTENPLKIGRHIFHYVSKNGAWIGLKRRH